MLPLSKKSKERITKLKERCFSNVFSTNIESFMAADFSLYLPDDLLVKVDRASMAVSLEVRVPFCDHRLAEWAFSLPFSFKFKGKQQKVLLKKLLNKVLPPHLYQRPKKGFAVPLGKYLREQLRDWAEELLKVKVLEESGFVEDGKVVNSLWQKHLKNANLDYSSFLWDALSYIQWFRAQKS